MRGVAMSGHRSGARWIFDMSGHSKWSQIKRKKASSDSKKAALFGKISQAITAAARGNPDPATNVRLRDEIRRARDVNMPVDTIERAISRARF